MGGMADLLETEAGARLTGICPVCEKVMHKRVSVKSIPLLAAKLDIHRQIRPTAGTSIPAHILTVEAEGLLADKGLQPGDLISEAAQQEIKNPDELSKLVAQAKKDKRPLLLLVDRKGELRFVAVSFGKSE